MAGRKLKFKLSKSLVSRISAIAVLVGMGSFAIIQSQLGGKEPDEKKDPKGPASQVASADGTDKKTEPNRDANSLSKSKSATGNKNGLPPNLSNVLNQNQKTLAPPPSAPSMGSSFGGGSSRRTALGSNSLKPKADDENKLTEPSKPSSNSLAAALNANSTRPGSQTSQSTSKPPTQPGAFAGGSFAPQSPSSSKTNVSSSLAETKSAISKPPTGFAPPAGISALSKQTSPSAPPAGGVSTSLSDTSDAVPAVVSNSTAAPAVISTSPPSNTPSLSPTSSATAPAVGYPNPSSPKAVATSSVVSDKTLGNSNRGVGVPAALAAGTVAAASASTLSGGTTNDTSSSIPTTPGTRQSTVPSTTQVPSSVNLGSSTKPTTSLASTNRTTYGGAPGSYGNNGQQRVAGTGVGASTTSSNAQSVPGAQRLEGTQTPALVIEKAAPSEVQVNKPATFLMLVKNVGQVDAHNVVVTDRIPAKTLLGQASPEPTSTAGDLLVWDLGTMKAGDQVEIELQVVPQETGELGSVAQVSFNAEASVRTICTQPNLSITQTTPSNVLIGDDLLMSIVIRNDGDGAATGVVIETDIPEQLSHPAGRQLIYELGTLGPNEVRELPLVLSARAPGMVATTILIRGDGDIALQEPLQLEVTAPQIDVTMSGPSKRYLERQATHYLEVENNGTAAATNVDMSVNLPAGLQFVDANNHGVYDAQSHAVFWSLEELPAGQSGKVMVVTLPVETGEQTFGYEASADLNLAANNEKSFVVEQLAELVFTIDDVADPIEIGSDTLYHIRVINQGSKAAKSIQLSVELPNSLELVGADGPSNSRAAGQVVTFEPIEQLNASGDLLFKIQARGLQEGDHRIRVMLQSDDQSQPVVKEENTRVYSDQ